jgi:hypothetical protein
MGKLGKLVLGVLTVLPEVTVVLVFGLVVGNFLEGRDGARWMSHQLSGWVFPALLVLAGFLGLALLPVYLIHVLRSRELTDNEKILWGILVGVVPVLSRPVYWWLFIFRSVPPHRLRVP